jgi:hypothetical protein
MVHVPAPTSVALPPETVHTPLVEELNVTGNLDEDEALRETEPPSLCAGIVKKVIVCSVPFTVKLWETGVAAA